MAKDLRPVYTAVNETGAKERYDEFADKWSTKHLGVRPLSWGLVTS